MKYIENDEFEILTKNGFKEFGGIKLTFRDDNYKISFDDNSNLICTPEHRIKDNKNEFIYARDIKIDMITSNNTKVIQIEKNVDVDINDFYDLIDVKGGNEYITENITSHNCAIIPTTLFEQFYEAMYPTISRADNAKIVLVSTPKGMNHFYSLWQNSVNQNNDYAPFTINWDEIPGRDEKWKKEQIRNMGIAKFEQEFNCVVGDTNIKIRNKLTGEIREVTMKELFDEDQYH